MAGNSSGVGWQRVVIIAAVSTAFAIFMDRIGAIDKLARMIGY